YYTPTLGSPYSLLYSVDNSTRIGAARQISLPAGCYWYRIYHRVRYTKCDGSIVQREVLIGPFYFCSNSGGGGGGLAETTEVLTENLSGDNLSDLEGDVVSNTPYTHAQLALKAEISVYPNPAQAMVMVAIPDGEIAELVRLIDLQGRIVLEQRVRDQQFELDCTPLPSGVYSVQVIYSDGSQVAKKVQVQH
ncbi:MAG: T9SS type A sorting domain-containing protein, partial [Saprospiraceae bacterium]|nr:T9SS type A sorting domain-containing protein [Saprospiraceae bacterium]